MRAGMCAALAAAACVISTGPALAQGDFPGDPFAGRDYARDACADCHRLPGQAEEGEAAPSFEAIAARWETTGMSLLAWLTSTPHPTMPNLIVPQDEAKDVVAYILSLQEP